MPLGALKFNSIQPRPKLPPKLPFHLRPLHDFARFFNGFEAACQVMSGSCVCLPSSFFRASESDVRHFFGGWFWQVGPPLELESCWGLAVSHACRTVPPKLPPKLPFYPRPLHGFAGFFNGFEAACQVMSGSCVGLSSSFFRASESDVRHFFGGWFSQVGPPLELESCWGLAVSHACRTVPLGALQFNPTEAEAATEAAIPSPSTRWFCTVF